MTQYQDNTAQFDRLNPAPAKSALTRNRLIFLAALMFVLGMIVLLRIFTPTTPIQKSQLTKKNFDGSISTFGVKYSGLDKSFPAKLSLATAQIQPFVEKEFLAGVLKTYKLTPVQADPLVWEGNNYTLVKDEASNMYTLANNQEAVRAKRIDVETAVTSANNIIKTAFPDQNLTLITADTRYLAGGNEQKEVSNNQAELIRLNYAPMVNNLPVIMGDRANAGATLLLDSDNNLVSMIFYGQIGTMSYQVQEPPFYQVYSIAQAIANINKGDGAIIAADNINYAKLDLNQKISGELKTVEVEYRLTSDATPPQLIPYFRFAGTISSNGQTFVGQIITPAIDIKRPQDS